MRVIVILLAVLLLLTTSCQSERPGHPYIIDGHTYIPASSLRIVNLAGQHTPVKYLDVNRNLQLYGTYKLYGGVAITFRFDMVQNEAYNYDFLYEPNTNRINIPGYYYYHPGAPNITFECKPYHCENRS